MLLLASYWEIEQKKPSEYANSDWKFNLKKVQNFVYLFRWKIHVKIEANAFDAKREERKREVERGIERQREKRRGKEKKTQLKNCANNYVSCRAFGGHAHSY